MNSLIHIHHFDNVGTVLFRRTVLFIALLLVGTASLHGQHGGGSDRMASRWWMALDGGVNAWGISEVPIDQRWDFQRLGWQAGLEVGRWSNPVLGWSLRLSAFSLNGETVSPLGASALLTMTLDWNNMNGLKLGGWHFYTPISVGAAASMDDNSQLRVSYALSAALGLRYGFGSGKVSLFWEAGMMATGPTLDWNSVDKGLGMMPSATMGLRFALSSSRIASHPYVAPALREEAGREPHGLVDDMLFTSEQQPIPATVVKFAFEGDELDDNAMRQLNLFVSQAKALGKESEFYILGVSDDARESQSHNRKLCERRCQAVYKALVEDFDFSFYRLQVLPKGGFAEYEHQYAEQMVLIIQHTPETEEVVKRWISNF